MVSTAWHQIGRVHEEAGRYEASEQAYRQSLAISVQENDPSGQADTLNQLGALYGRMDRDEEAVALYKQAAEIKIRDGDLSKEGKVRSNLAGVLLNLRRYEEARQELERAIECKKPYGVAAEPWKTWATLEDLEQATGHTQDAQAARSQAIETYLDYRRAGGDSQSTIPLFALVAQAVQQNTQEQAARQLNDLLEPDDPPSFTMLIRKLHSVLAGDRDPALAADDDELTYTAVAELRFLLETLDQADPDKKQE
jgi:tetratricopeptide (TPR) repeat protein